jgi:hypothetical protein
MENNQSDTSQSEENESPKSMLFNMLFNIIIPVVILSKLSAEEYLGPLYGLGVALIFPVSYGAYDLISKRKMNYISLLGLVSVLLTGGLALFKLSGFWFAVKEAAIPGLIGLFILVTLKTKYSVSRLMLYNQKIFNVSLIDERLSIRGTVSVFEKLLTRVTMILAFTFFLSAVLNFVLAYVLLKSPTGTPEFNEELGTMTALSFPVIMIPTMVVMLFGMWFLIKGIKQLTGLEMDEMIKNSQVAKSSSQTPPTT